VSVVKDVVLHDESRDRDIPLRIFAPEAAGNYPVILFSHGSGGSREGFGYLGEFWADHGYVAVHLTHQGTDTATLKVAGPMAVREQSLKPATWRERAQDVTAVLDGLKSLEQRNATLRGKLDTTEVGMAGHSFGAYTTMLMAGTTVATDRSEAEAFADPRLRAFLAISPQGTGQQGLTQTSWQNVKPPMLFVTGTEDRTMQAELDYKWRAEGFEYSPPGDKYLAIIQGAQHFSFSDRGGQSRLGTRVQAFVRVLSLSFWDAYLKHNKQAKTFLLSREVSTRTQGRVTFVQK